MTDNFPLLWSSLQTPLFSLPTIHTYLSIQFTHGEDMYRCQMRVCGDCLSYPFWFKAVKDSFLVLANTHLASKCISNCWSEWKSRNYSCLDCIGFISWNHGGESWLTKEHLLLSNCVSATDNQGVWVASYGSQGFLNCKLYNRFLIREVISRTAVPSWSNDNICHQWLSR